MEWVDAITEAVQYIESHITDDITAVDVANQVYMSPFYFQKGFSMLCGYTLSEYIRNRRLALAGEELAASDAKIIDIAMKYGYDSPDSFTKAFTRFHGTSPKKVQKENGMVKAFAPLQLTISLKGGYMMNYKIEEKQSFTIQGVAKRFNSETSKQEIPKFWNEHYASGNGKYICGTFGICIDEKMEDTEFEYLIADVYNPSSELPEGCITRVIPAFTWAIFDCNGPMPTSLQEVNQKIFSEWLPAMKEYEIAAGYSVEMYDDPKKYPNGTHDKNYHSEIWIPIKKK